MSLFMGNNTETTLAHVLPYKPVLDHEYKPVKQT
jgi:hypothetical protein